MYLPVTNWNARFNRQSTNRLSWRDPVAVSPDFQTAGLNGGGLVDRIVRMCARKGDSCSMGSRRWTVSIDVSPGLVKISKKQPGRSDSNPQIQMR